MRFLLSAPLTLLLAGVASCQSGIYSIHDVGTFNYLLAVDFSRSSSLPADLAIKTHTVGAGAAPYARSFGPDTVKFNDRDSLSLLVPGPPDTSSAVASAEIGTSYSDILYASVRTVAKASNVAGTCHGLFFYQDDTQETDIEVLTKDLSKLWFTNQANTPGTSETSTSVSAPADIAQAYHEYRLDWLRDRTDYYVDGIKQATLNSNVTSIPGAWLWNNWANGGPWTGPLPASTSDLRIQQITAYFNRTSLNAPQSSASTVSLASSTTTTSTSKSTSRAYSTASTKSSVTKAMSSSSQKTTTSSSKPKSTIKSTTGTTAKTTARTSVKSSSRTTSMLPRSTVTRR